MFDFEKLTVYKKAKIFNAGIRAFIKAKRLDNTTNDQLRRAAFSVVLNLAEGSGRFTKPDRRNFYIIARSSVFECIAILDVLKDEAMVEESVFNSFYNQGEELSRIIFTMIANLQQAKWFGRPQWATRPTLQLATSNEIKSWRGRIPSGYKLAFILATLSAFSTINKHRITLFSM